MVPILWSTPPEARAASCCETKSARSFAGEARLAADDGGSASRTDAVSMSTCEPDDNGAGERPKPLLARAPMIKTGKEGGDMPLPEGRS